jgi:hypothetical protein
MAEIHSWFSSWLSADRVWIPTDTTLRGGQFVFKRKDKEKAGTGTQNGIG